MDAIHFVFIAEGSVKGDLVAEFIRKNLTNIEFLSEVPEDKNCQIHLPGQHLFGPSKKENPFLRGLVFKDI